jgi:predicted glycoside hydrolase/deacetylase ChbG (UPF0249 family)
MDIIINADDLGYSESINNAIFDLMYKKRISSASLMANGKSIDSAIVESIKLKDCSFAVHLNLTELRPFTNINIWKKYKIADENNEFCKTIRKVKPNVEIKRAVFEEFSAQIEFLLNAGAKICHIDSHHHIHTIPWLFFILKDIQKKYGIYKVRSTLNLYEKKNVIRSLQKMVWNTTIRHFPMTKTTDYFTPFLWFVNSLDKKVNTSKTIELMVHPNKEEKNEELNTLYSDWQSKLNFKVRLISYNDLQ